MLHCDLDHRINAWIQPHKILEHNVLLRLKRLLYEIASQINAIDVHVQTVHNHDKLHYIHVHVCVYVVYACLDCIISACNSCCSL